MDKYGIGKIFKNNNGDEYEIVEVLDSKYKLVRFLSTGYEKQTQIQTIRVGGAVDDSNKLYEVRVKRIYF